MYLFAAYVYVDYTYDTRRASCGKSENHEKNLRARYPPSPVYIIYTVWCTCFFVLPVHILKIPRRRWRGGVDGGGSAYGPTQELHGITITVTITINNYS